MGLLTDWVGGGGGPPPLKSVTHISYNDETWHSYTSTKKDPKNICIMWHTPWVLLTSPFFTGNQQILLYQEIQIKVTFWYIISNSFNFFFQSLKIVLINMLMMSAKMGTLGLLKINAWWNKGYDVIIFFPYHHKQNFINWVKLCCRFGHVTKVCLLQHFFERSYHNLNFIRIWPGKALFLRCALGSSSINWDWH